VRHALPMAVWVGVDVGGRRKGFDVAVIDDRRVLALWSRLTCGQVVDIVIENRPAVVAIDSPRSCAPEGQAARDGEILIARSICGIRWTPDARRVQGSTYAKIPYRDTNKPESQKQANKAHARLRAPGERANAQLKSWQILRKLRCCPWRAGQLAKAIHVFQILEVP
jgi:hypothetical protein